MRIRKFVIAGLFCALCTTSAYGASKIKTIDYQGNQRISDQTIFAYLQLNSGDNFDQKKVDESIKSLFKTGFFSDVKINITGSTLLVQVTENPMISKIYLDGNKRIEDSDLMPELSMQAHSVFSVTKMQNDIRRMVNLYQKRGRYSVKIEPKIIKLDQNRVNLIYEIEEGGQAKIKKINIDGNESFSDADIIDAIASREERWYRFFSSVDVYDPDKLEYDKEQIRRFYMNRGYADFKVTSATAELSPKRDAFLITFVVDEGALYAFGDINVSSNIKNIDVEKLTPLLTIKTGKKYSKEAIEESVDALTTYLGNHGYPFVDIEPEVKNNKETLTSSIVFNIKESPKVYIDKINIKNNTRTLDKVIRREFRISEGDPYNISKIQRSKQRIENLGFFNKIEFKNKKTDSPDKMDLEVEVEEASTGSLNFAAGYNTSSGPLGSISLSENNFLGKGQQLALGFVQAQKQSDYTFSFTEPYFMDKELSAGFDIFLSQQDLKKQSAFSSRTKGFTLRSGYEITENLSHGVRYSLKEEDIRDVSADASIYVKAQKGRNTVSSVGHTLTYDRLDSRIDPTDGYILKLSQDIAGLGGQTNYLMHEGVAAYYKPLYKKEFVLKLSGKAANVQGYGGKKVKLNDRFMIGPEYIRGFDIAGIGPRDKKTADALGGNSYYAGTAEITFPVGLPEELGVKGAVFTDAGSLFGIDEKDKSKIHDVHSLRASTGASLIWKSPFGTMSLHYAVPYKKEKFDDVRKFYFNFGTKF
jgi:outer membrane protein insertion porin family